ncbi:uncharacterized protein EV420DRAFT_1646172 [Desarmillaria tabescens]|uniref:Eisosome component PIL1-domain-containing protein n=1 Tax=Armillaria tabescens TaxID=1929756 RepID=A0AA39JZB1_ARMTA|nr:uncharacterized protein EV420DRAFT_1646172 [Desarmillaria tabescens]KAK0451422.1 hypothetical protein EV420DRAFT_1646172 [Desarmillaria tabescens]
MFKTAATKLAHNSTLPSLAGHSDIRPLQDLITAEKAVLISLQKLSVDLTKAAEALRTWGAGEGEDLGDALGASTSIIAHFTHALTSYATHEHAIRDHMKSIRAREEALDDLKRKRKVIVGKAETAERKLSKMSPEHKNLAMQTDTLNQLRDQIRSLDSDIMTGEASLGDFKRSTTRSMMGLKFGGLLELSEKGVIVGDYGKLVVSEIPEDVTQPGMPRLMYTGHPKVEMLVSETYKAVNQVGFSTVASDLREQQRPPIPSLPSSPARPARMDEAPSSSTFLFAPQGMNGGHFLDASDAPSPSNSPSTSVLRKDSLGDNFGPRKKETEAYGYSGSAPPSSFPVKTPFSIETPLLKSHEPELSFSSSIAEALKSPGFGNPIDEPAPSYEVSHSHLYAPPPGPPLGAAVLGSEPGSRRVSTALSDDAELAYVAGEEDTTHEHGDDRHVRFGRVGDVDEEKARPQVQVEPEPKKDSPIGRSPRRIPVPPVSTEDEERELNAAAAREVSRELDALTFNPPLPPPSPRKDSEESPERGRPLIPAPSSLGYGPPPNREPSPLAPPSAPFATRSISNIETTVPTPAQSYAQAHRSSSSFGSRNEGASSPLVESRPLPPTIHLQGGRSSPGPSLNSPYRTNAPEFPTPRPAFAGRVRSSSSSSSSAQLPSGARTISAAAFRRPPPRVTSNGGSVDISSSPTASLGLGASPPLPPVPVPGPADTSPLSFSKKRSAVGGSPLPSNRGSGPVLPPAQDGRRNSFVERERSDSPVSEEYDYLDAYVDEHETNRKSLPPADGSPMQQDFGSLGNVKVMNDDGSPSKGGYGEGKFATDLEGGLR